MSENLSRVEFAESGLPMIEADGEFRVLGCLPPTRVFSAAPDFGASFQILPENEWEECSLSNWITVWRNQRQESSCVGQSSSYGFDIAWQLGGNAPKKFSPWWIYGLINGGQDRGAQVADAAEVLKLRGVCTDDLVPQGMLYSRQFPPEAASVAQHYKAFNIYKINSWEQLGTAVHLRIPVISGIAVGRNFSNLDSEGVVPLPDAVIGGHALCHAGLKRSRRGVWLIECPNSYGRNWGVNGVCWLRKEHWNPLYGFPFDSYAILSTLSDPSEPGVNPVA